MADWITIEEARAAEGISRREMYNRLTPGDAHYVVSQDRKLIDGKRGTMVHVASLSPAARSKLLKEELARVQQPASATRQMDANLSRKLGVEPEAALRRATDKFSARFEAMEQSLAARGRLLTEATLDEMEAEWGRVKTAAEGTKT